MGTTQTKELAEILRKQAVYQLRLQMLEGETPEAVLKASEEALQAEELQLKQVEEHQLQRAEAEHQLQQGAMELRRAMVEFLREEVALQQMAQMVPEKETPETTKPLDTPVRTQMAKVWGLPEAEEKTTE